MALAIVFDSVGVGEWFTLLAVVLIVVGPRKLPATARKIGQYYSKFRRAAESFKRQLMDMDTEFDRAVAGAENSAKEAFTVEGDEASAEPVQYDGSNYEPPYDPSDYGEDDPYARYDETSEPAAESASASEPAPAPEPASAAEPAPAPESEPATKTAPAEA